MRLLLALHALDVSFHFARVALLVFARLHYERLKYTKLRSTMSSHDYASNNGGQGRVFGTAASYIFVPEQVIAYLH